MKQLIQTTTLFAETLLLAAVMTGCGEPTSQAPVAAPQAISSAQELDSPAARSAESDVAEATVDVAEAPAISSLAAARAPAAATAATAAGGPQLATIAEAPSSNGLRLRRFVVARDVESREPVGTAARFERNSGAVYAFLDMASSNDEEQAVAVTFEHEDGRTVGPVSLDIPANAPRWRTWALSRGLGREGGWRAVARTAEGEILGEVPFEMI